MRSGYTVLTASNSQEALDVYRSDKGNIALVILDLVMPGMGGKDCLTGLLEIDSAAKVLIASGYAADEIRKECLGIGAKGFVVKPFKFKTLLVQVRKTLDSD
jgi:DNA-binding response OmpR family regulator